MRSPACRRPSSPPAPCSPTSSASWTTASAPGRSCRPARSRRPSLAVGVAARPRGATEFTVASFNLQRVFDTVNDPAIGDPVPTAAAYDLKLAKLSAAIRDYLHAPDILGVQEAENIDGAAGPGGPHRRRRAGRQPAAAGVHGASRRGQRRRRHRRRLPDRVACERRQRHAARRCRHLHQSTQRRAGTAERSAVAVASRHGRGGAGHLAGRRRGRRESPAVAQRPHRRAGRGPGAGQAAGPGRVRGAGS